MIETKTIKLPDNSRYEECVPPTRRCTICEKLENPEANLIIGHTWICPSCAEKSASSSASELLFLWIEISKDTLKTCFKKVKDIE